ncbi:MAG: carboxypeptidase regulatory-like domain-containing protein [Planctomycetaceae bacterium]|nr:carboxypeptidase regulatory-like domain-containing protein [Planctomycetaceae bacterium]
MTMIHIPLNHNLAERCCHVIFAFACLCGLPSEAQPPKEQIVRLQGVVRDPFGKPVTEAIVYVTSRSDHQQVEQLVTDSDGCFIADQEQQSVGTVYVHKDGFATASQPAPWEYYDLRRMEITLRTSSPFVGRIIDDQGNRIAGAKVGVEYYKISTGPDTSERHYFPPGDMLPHKLRPYVRTETNTQGEFRFDHLPDQTRAHFVVSRPGIAFLRTVMSSGHRDKVFTGTVDQPAIIEVEREGVIEGRVVTSLEGVSVQGLKIRLQCGLELLTADGSGVVPLTLQPDTMTDREGRFRFDGLAAGRANIILVDHEACPPWTYHAICNISIREGETTPAEIELISGTLVEGQVVDPYGQPLPDVQVSLTGFHRPKIGNDLLLTTTGPDGKYRFRLPSGSGSVFAVGRHMNAKRGDVARLEIDSGERSIDGPRLVIVP